jgi:hypothetical protein
MTAQDEGTELRERPLGEVARDLTKDISLLVRQELELAKAELGQKARTAAPGVGMLGGAAVVGLAALGATTTFAILTLAIVLDAWLAALLVAIVLGVTAYLLMNWGKERVAKAGAPVPEQTIETVKEDVEWAKTRATSARK